MKNIIGLIGFLIFLPVSIYSSTKLGAIVGSDKVSIEKYDGSLFGLSVFFEAPVTHRLHAGILAGFSSGDIDKGPTIRDEVALEVITLSGYGKYLFNPNGLISPYVLGGVAYHNMNSEGNRIPKGKNSETRTHSDSTLGLEGGGGLLFEVNPAVNLFGEARFKSGNELDLFANDQQYDILSINFGLSALL